MSEKVSNAHGYRAVWMRAFRLRIGLAILCSFASVSLVSCSLCCRWIRYLTEPPYRLLVDELPESARLLRYDLIRHGIDYCHLFEFACSDGALCDILVARWKLDELTGTSEYPTSFVEFDHPEWWTPTSPTPTRIFARRDEKTEQYLSVWEQAQVNRLYVEYGRW
ncbi:hypothetical protein [Thermopirellula anaerolimosa]